MAPDPLDPEESVERLVPRDPRVCLAPEASPDLRDRGVNPVFLDHREDGDCPEKLDRLGNQDPRATVELRVPVDPRVRYRKHIT